MIDAKDPLTGKQKEVLRCIEKSIKERGYPPSVREIGRDMGISSTRGVADHLKALKKKGYIDIDSTARGIRLLQATGQEDKLAGYKHLLNDRTILGR